MTNYHVYADQETAQAAADDMTTKYVPHVEEVDLAGNPAAHQQVTQRWDVPRQRNDGQWIIQEYPGYVPVPPPIATEAYDPAWFVHIPVITTLSPANNATDVDGAANLIATFDGPIAFGIGSVHLYDGANQHVASLTAPGHVGTGGGSLNITGNVLTIDPANTMRDGERYYVLMDETLINGFPGISDKLVWNWKIALAPVRKVASRAAAKKTPAKKKR